MAQTWQDLVAGYLDSRKRGIDFVVATVIASSDSRYHHPGTQLIFPRDQDHKQLLLERGVDCALAGSIRRCFQDGDTILCNNVSNRTPGHPTAHCKVDLLLQFQAAGLDTGPLAMLCRCLENGGDCVMVTVSESEMESLPPGSMMLLDAEGNQLTPLVTGCGDEIPETAQSVYAACRSSVESFIMDHGSFSALFHILKPLPRPLILGQGVPADQLADMKKLHAMVLAAGGSTRFGGIKQLVELEGKSLLKRAVETATRILDERVIVVLGLKAQKLKRELSGFRTTTVINEHWEYGLSTSLRAGIAAIPGDAAGVLILFCDQPFVREQDLRELIRIWLSNPESIIAASYNGTQGVPVLFPRKYFAEFALLDGDRGAKAVLERHPGAVIAVPLQAAARDIDTQSDLLAVLTGQTI